MSAQTTNSKEGGMTCERVMKENLAEQYLVGALSAPQQDAFEQHYFECPRCFEELDQHRLLQQALQQAETDIRRETVAPRPSWNWQWGAVAVAATVILAVALGIWYGRPRATSPTVATPSSPPSQGPQGTQPPVAHQPSLVELAKFEPPAYTPIVLRGSSDAARQHFQAAMRHYSKADYAGAIPGLRQASALDPQAADSHFYLGVCYLLVGETDAGIQALKGAVALGESAYLEDARFYLAKAYLRTGNLSAAREELNQTVQLKGDRQSEARQMLEKLDHRRE
jgi:tetratricopeptide (TPR) repeat protein